MKRIEDYVAGLYGIEVERLFCEDHHRPIVEARSICMSAMKDFAGSRVGRIATHFGKSHGAVSYCIKMVRTLYATNKAFRAKVDNVYDACADGDIMFTMTPSREMADANYLDEDMNNLADLV